MSSIQTYQEIQILPSHNSGKIICIINVSFCRKWASICFRSGQLIVIYFTAFFPSVFICERLLKTFGLRVTVLPLCFATISCTMLTLWNSKSMHSSNGAQHTVGGACVEKKISLCLDIRNCKEKLGEVAIHSIGTGLKSIKIV